MVELWALYAGVSYLWASSLGPTLSHVELSRHHTHQKQHQHQLQRHQINLLLRYIWGKRGGGGEREGEREEGEERERGRERRGIDGIAVFLL